MKLFLSSPGFHPPGEALCCSLRFCPPREAGAALMMLRLPVGEALPFFPGVLSPRGSSTLFLGVLSPKGSLVGVDDAALSSRCRTAVARHWAIRHISADNAVQPMKADAAPGLYTLLLSRRRRADVSDLRFTTTWSYSIYITLWAMNRVFGL